MNDEDEDGDTFVVIQLSMVGFWILIWALTAGIWKTIEVIYFLGRVIWG